MKNPHLTASLLTLIAVNLIPLIGATYANWNIFSVLLGYWLETAIIGFFTIKRMQYAAAHQHESATDPFSAATFYIPFFLTHFGIFMLVHLIFILAFFFSTTISLSGLLIMAISLFGSHYLSFQQNFVDNREYTQVKPDGLFWRPYPRVLVMHLTVIFGSFLALGLNQPEGSLVLLIVLKTIADAATHVIEHSQLAKRVALV